MPEGMLCAIPARGGSKRLRRKNLRALAGKPMIAHTIEVARQLAVRFPQQKELGQLAKALNVSRAPDYYLVEKALK